MRTRTIIEDGLYRTEYIYRPSELSEKLKEKVCEKYRDWHTADSWWYESAMEYWKERLEEFGFEDAAEQYSSDGCSTPVKRKAKKTIRIIKSKLYVW